MNSLKDFVFVTVSLIFLEGGGGMGMCVVFGAGGVVVELLVQRFLHIA